MERDPFQRVSSAPLLPEQYCVTEYYNTHERQSRLVIKAEQDYQVEDSLRERLSAAGSILKAAGISHPAGTREYIIPEGLISLSAFLNATYSDQHRMWKRRYVFDQINMSLSRLSNEGISLQARPTASRFNVGLSDIGDMVLLPVNLSITREPQEQATEHNQAFLYQLERDIIEVAPSDDRDFPF